MASQQPVDISEDESGMAMDTHLKTRDEVTEQTHKPGHLGKAVWPPQFIPHLWYHLSLARVLRLG